MFLGAVLLCLEDNDALPGYTMVAQSPQALLVNGRQTGRINIKAQMNGAGYLVDILPTGPLGAYCTDVNLIVRDLEGVAND